MSPRGFANARSWRIRREKPRGTSRRSRLRTRSGPGSRSRRRTTTRTFPPSRPATSRSCTGKRGSSESTTSRKRSRTCFAPSAKRSRTGPAQSGSGRRRRASGFRTSEVSPRAGARYGAGTLRASASCSRTALTFHSSTSGNQSRNCSTVAPLPRFSKKGRHGHPRSRECPRSAELAGAAFNRRACVPIGHQVISGCLHLGLNFVALRHHPVDFRRVPVGKQMVAPRPHSRPGIAERAPNWPTIPGGIVARHSPVGGSA